MLVLAYELLRRLQSKTYRVPCTFRTPFTLYVFKANFSHSVCFFAQCMSSVVNRIRSIFLQKDVDSFWDPTQIAKKQNCRTQKKGTHSFGWVPFYRRKLLRWVPDVLCWNIRMIYLLPTEKVWEWRRSRIKRFGDMWVCRQRRYSINHFQQKNLTDEEVLFTETTSFWHIQILFFREKSGTT